MRAVLYQSNRSCAYGNRLIWRPVLGYAFKQTMKVARSELFYGLSDGVDGPPMESAKCRCLIRRRLRVYCWIKVVCLYEVIDFVLAVGPTVPREFVISIPQGRSQTKIPSASLFGNFPSQCFFLRLTGFQAAAGRNPNVNSRGRLYLHHQHSMVWGQDDRAYSLALNHRCIFRWFMDVI